MEESNDNLGSVDPNEGGVDAPDAGQSTPVTETEGEHQSAEPSPSSIDDPRFQGEDGVEKLYGSYKESEQELRKTKEETAKVRKLAEQLSKQTGYSVDEMLDQINGQSVERPDPRAVDQPVVDQPYNTGSISEDERIKQAALNAEAAVWELKAEKELNEFKEAHPDVPNEVAENIKKLGFMPGYNKKSYESIYKELYAPVVQKATDTAHKDLDHKRMTQPASAAQTREAPVQNEGEQLRSAIESGKWRDPDFMARMRSN